MEKMEEDHWLAKRLLIITGDLRLAEENLFAMEARNARRREDEAFMTACRTETQQDQELARHAEYLEQKLEHEQRVLVLKRNFKEQEAAIKLFRDTEYHRHQRDLELLHEAKLLKRVHALWQHRPRDADMPHRPGRREPRGVPLGVRSPS